MIRHRFAELVSVHSWQALTPSLMVCFMRLQKSKHKSQFLFALSSADVNALLFRICAARFAISACVLLQICPVWHKVECKFLVRAKLENGNQPFCLLDWTKMCLHLDKGSQLTQLRVLFRF